MHKYQIQAFVRGEWRDRAVVEAKSDNAALRAYGLRGTRPRLGQATSASGKRFQAVVIVPTPPKPARKRAAKKSA